MPLPKEVLDAFEAKDAAALEAAIEQHMVKPVKDKNQELLGEKASWSTRYDEKVRELLSKDANSLLKLHETEWNKREEAYKKEIEQKNKDIEEYVVDSALNSTLAGRVASDIRLLDAKRALRNEVKAIRDEQGKLQVIAETAGGNFPIKQYVDDWLQTDVGKEYAAPPDHKGGGQRNLVPKPAALGPKQNLTDPKQAVAYIKQHGPEAYRKAVAQTLQQTAPGA